MVFTVSLISILIKNTYVPKCMYVRLFTNLMVENFPIYSPVLSGSSSLWLVMFMQCILCRRLKIFGQNYNFLSHCEFNISEMAASYTSVSLYIIFFHYHGNPSYFLYFKTDLIHSIKFNFRVILLWIQGE